MIAWIKRHARALWIAAGISAVIGSIVAWRTWDYIQNDPTFCTSCHLMEGPFDKWAESPHGKLNCHTCHPGSLMSNLHQLWVTFTEHPTEVKKHAVVPAKICGSCHLANDARWKQVGATAGHQVHYNELKIECVQCHAPSVHKFLPTNDMCMKCHPAQTVGLTAMQQLNCQDCHRFLAAPGQPLREGDHRCEECHAPGSEVAPPAPVWHTETRCIDCHPVHDAALAAIAADSATGPQRVDRVVPCAECHGREQALPMPEAHTCDACHEPHALPASEANCRDCHQDVAAILPQREHHACADCHQPHAPSEPAGDQCATCHADRSALANRTPIEAHRACDACHQKHDVEAPDGPACAVCHAEAAKVVARGPARHQKCAGCHAIHAPEAVRRCESCHRDERLGVRAGPQNNKHQRCATCHTAHDARASQATECTSCHKKEAAAARLQPKDHGKCTNCHAPHGPKVPDQQACSGCHQPVFAALAPEPPKHRDCRSCHPWHDKSLKARDDGCKTCHQDKRPRGVPKHTQCNSCHQTHQMRDAKPCASCHAEKVPKAGEPAAHGECGKCHGPTHAQVAAAKDPCGSCHADVVKAGLHRVPGHLECLDCHQPHGKSRPKAAECVRCHPPEKIRNHPAAARGVQQCYGCHAFGR